MDEHIAKILDERVAYKGKVFSVLERDVEVAPGKIETWEVATRNNTVGIVPVDESQNVLLIEEYMGGLNEYALTLPGGKIDNGEDAATAADRELQEETGYKGNLTELITVGVSPGYMTQRTTIFLAQNLRPSKLKGDEEYRLEVRRIPLREALALCESGRMPVPRDVIGLLLVARKLGVR